MPDAGADRSVPLSAEDLSFWYADQPRQRTTMALLMLLDRPPDPERLRAAAWRAVEAVPRLRQRVVDAPFDVALPRWEDDPTFDLDFHVRRYSLGSDVPTDAALEGMFRTVGPIYERPFDRTRPLWELIEIDAPGPGSAIFFRLHHAVADGVGGNTILAALTDERRDVVAPPPPHKLPGAWEEASLASRLAGALLRRAGEDAARWRGVAGAAVGAVLDPASLVSAARTVGQLVEDARWRSRSPLRAFGRSRHLSGFDLPFEPLRRARRELGGRMIDVLLTALADAAGRWHREQGIEDVDELLTLVPINLRVREEQGLTAGLGNRATGILVRVPVGPCDPLRRFHEIHRRVEARKRHPSAQFFPQLAAVMATLPRPLYRTAAYAASGSVDLILTNVPGVPHARYVAGAEILAAYPFAPVAPHSPVSIATYGYRGRLFVGLDADGTSMPDAAAFRDMLADAFASLLDRTGVGTT